MWEKQYERFALDKLIHTQYSPNGWQKDENVDVKNIVGIVDAMQGIYCENNIFTTK